MNSEERHEARYQRRKQKRLNKLIKRNEQYSNWDDVFGLMPLIEGYQNTSKASRKRTQTQVWMNNLVINTRKEVVALENFTWRSRGFNKFRIQERGKWRDILSVHISEKGIQNTFCNNYLVPIIRPHLIYDNGASIKGKGTDFAINRLTKHLQDHFRKYGREGGIFFYDFSSYFASIPLIPLTNKVRQKVLIEAMMKMYETFVFAFGEIGLGLGSQVSQISAVFFPNEIDHMLKDEMGIHGNGRYMDDGYFMCNDIDKLKQFVKAFEKKCSELGITLNKKRCHIVKLTKQFVFLKTRFFITASGKVVKRLNRAVPKKERARLKAFKKFVDMGIMTFHEAYLNFHSWLLSLNRGKSYHVMLNAILYFDELFDSYGYYWPIKVKTRKHKILRHLATTAHLELLKGTC